MYTTKMCVARIFKLLGGPSATGLRQEQLYFEDVRDVINARLRAYVQDADLAGRDRRTARAELTVEADDVDFRASLPNVPDFEPEALEYSCGAGWRKVNLVSLQALRHHRDGEWAAFYGSDSLESGQKLAFSGPSSAIASRTYRLTYRVPLLVAVQMGERPPLPENFMPMVEYDGAIDSYPLVRGVPDDYHAWWRRVEPIYTARAGEWRERYQSYLTRSVEDPAQPLPRFDDFRRWRARASPSAYLPRE
jgi:hypothetical protein